VRSRRTGRLRLWGDERLDFLRRFLPYERGLPSHDTLNDVINGLDAELFKTCFANWVEALRDRAPDIIAIDGKTSRRTHARRKGRGPLHLVSAWAARQRLVLGQEAVDEKSNEIEPRRARPRHLPFLSRSLSNRPRSSVQEGPDVADEQRVVLKQRAVAGVGIEDQLSVAESLEHCVGVVRRHHGVVAAADHESGLGDGAQGGVLGIRRGAPSDHRLGLRIGHGAAIFGVPIFRTDLSPLQE
jgi:hypothetical protein